MQLRETERASGRPLAGVGRVYLRRERAIVSASC